MVRTVCADASRVHTLLRSCTEMKSSGTCFCCSDTYQQANASHCADKGSWVAQVLVESEWPRDRRGDLAPGGEQGAPWFHHPVMSYEGGNLTTVFAPHLVRMAQRWPDAPRLTPLQEEALDMVTALAGSPELRMQARLPGKGGPGFDDEESGARSCTSSLSSC